CPPEDVGGVAWLCGMPVGLGRQTREGLRFALPICLPSVGAAPSAVAVPRYPATCFAVSGPHLCGTGGVTGLRRAAQSGASAGRAPAALRRASGWTSPAPSAPQRLAG